MSTRGRTEPIIDYSHSQILTSNEHVGKLRRIADKKTMVEEEKATKLRNRELTKRRRAEEKILEGAAKRRRASELEARKLAKKNWTTTTIRAVGKRMQQLVKNSCPQQIRQLRLDVEARGIAKQNRLIAKVRWEAKKNKIKNGIPLPSEPFHALVDHSKFSELLVGRNANGVVGTRDGLGVSLPVAHLQRWLIEA